MTLDLYALPSPTFGEVQTFTGLSLDVSRTSTTNTQWLEWQKPRGATMVQILAIGGGGGGGTGFQFPAGNQRGGGGGGGSGAQSMVLIPATLLPDRLYIQTGFGGSGGIPNGDPNNRSADAGGITYVCVYPDVATDNVLCYAAYGFPGLNGTGDSSNNPGGAGGTVANLGLMPVAAGGVYSFLAGQAGAVGGSGLGGGGGTITPPTTGLRCMGAPGGSGCWTQTNGVIGSAFTPPLNTYLADQAPAAAAANGGNGASPPPSWAPMTFWAGGGGAGSYGVPGGRGGNGAYGSGGGGGGAGTNTTRTGGSGGGGIVVITTW